MIGFSVGFPACKTRCERACFSRKDLAVNAAVCQALCNGIPGVLPVEFAESFEPSPQRGDPGSER